MIADSIKVKGYSYFGDNWGEFKEVKPITVIIGKNNSGKSHYLDLVAALSNNSDELQICDIQWFGEITKDIVSAIYTQLNASEKTSVRNSTRMACQKSDYPTILDDIDFKGLLDRLDGTKIFWQLDQDTEDYTLGSSNSMRSYEEHLIKRLLHRVENHFSTRTFCRLNADRDITPEYESANYDSIEPILLKGNGEGATDIFRRFTVGDANHTLSNIINNDLLGDINRIFGCDDYFSNFTTRYSQNPNAQDQHDLWELFIQEKGKNSYPISKLGSGLKTILLVLLNLLVLPKLPRENQQKLPPISEYVFAFEELENNLHPALLRRLLEYLSEYVKEHKCHLFLTTHSNVVLDYFSQDEDAQILQVTHDGKSASVRTIETHFDRVGILDDLGAKPSDLLQANGILWLEGPSDRIYLNKLIELYSDDEEGGKLIEGRHYQCAFYGGSNLANVEFTAEEEAEFTNLLRLNHNIAVLCDSDKESAGDTLKPRVKKTKEEINEIRKAGRDAYLWITEAREIENYIPAMVWKEVYDENQTQELDSPSQYDRFPSSPSSQGDYLFDKFNKTNFEKVPIAKKAIKHFTKEMFEDRFDIKEQMEALVAAIRKWNE